MVTRYVNAVPTTIASISTTNFPKVILFADGSEVVADLTEQNAAIAGADAATVVWEPDEQLEIDLIFGRDFDTCVFASYAGTTRIVKRRIPAPVLTDGNPSIAIGGEPSLEWTNAFQIPTKIYRTAVYLTTNPLTEFVLIAEIPGTITPGGTITYLDSSISLADETEAASYFVMNANGTSNTVEFIGETLPVV